MTHPKKNRRRSVVAAVALVFLYVITYLALSRHGFAVADQQGFKGFYFVTPRNNNVVRAGNAALNVFYLPLIKLDQLIGTGRPIASEPLWQME